MAYSRRYTVYGKCQTNIRPPSTVSRLPSTTGGQADLVGEWTTGTVTFEFEVDGMRLVDWYQVEREYSLQDTEQLVFNSTPLDFAFEDTMAFGEDNSFNSTVNPTFSFFIFTLTDLFLGRDVIIPGLPVRGTWALIGESNELIITSSANSETTTVDVPFVNPGRMALRFTGTQSIDLSGDEADNKLVVKVQFILTR
jgi:hypothetical protein